MVHVAARDSQSPRVRCPTLRPESALLWPTLEIHPHRTCLPLFFQATSFVAFSAAMACCGGAARLCTLKLDSVTSVASKLLQLLSEVSPLHQLVTFFFFFPEPFSPLSINFVPAGLRPLLPFCNAEFAFILCPIPSCFPRDIDCTEG